MRALGAIAVTSTAGGVYFQADAATVYRVVYMTRLPSRILAPLRQFACPDAEALYRSAASIAWIGFFSPQESFAVLATVAGNPHIRHSQFAAQRVKDAVVDYFRRTTGQRPSVERQHAEAWIHLHLAGERATLSFDLAGGSLHRRGYRAAGTAAPLQETIAAAIIGFSGWQGERPLIDPMCGSGTLLCEALMHYCRMPAGLLRRRFGFEMLPDFNPAVWHAVRAAVRAGMRPLPEGLISGSDRDPHAVAAARANLQRLPGGAAVPLQVADMRELAPTRQALLVCNPPFGIRLDPEEDLRPLYRDLGEMLKRRCPDSTAFIFCGNRDLIGAIGLQPSAKIPIRSGGLDGRLVKFEIHRR